MTNEQNLRDVLEKLRQHHQGYQRANGRNIPENIPLPITLTYGELSVLAALNPQEGEEPDASGGFIGDLWFGHPVKRTLATHRWNGSAWNELPSELESVLELLAKARTEIATLRASQLQTPAPAPKPSSLPYIGSDGGKVKRAEEFNRVLRETMERTSHPVESIQPDAHAKLVEAANERARVAENHVSFVRDTLTKLMEDHGGPSDRVPRIFLSGSTIAHWLVALGSVVGWAEALPPREGER